MPFADLHEFVQGQFAAFAGYDEYEAQLTIWAHMQRSKNHDAIQDWRWRHPEIVRGYTRNWRARRPADQCSQCSSKHLPGRKTCQVHLERDRARAAARYAAKLRAA